MGNETSAPAEGSILAKLEGSLPARDGFSLDQKQYTPQAVERRHSPQHVERLYSPQNGEIPAPLQYATSPHRTVHPEPLYASSPARDGLSLDLRRHSPQHVERRYSPQYIETPPPLQYATSPHRTVSLKSPPHLIPLLYEQPAPTLFASPTQHGTVPMPNMPSIQVIGHLPAPKGIGLDFECGGHLNAAVITRVSRGSPAEEAGVLPGDKMLGVTHTKSRITSEFTGLMHPQHLTAILQNTWQDAKLAGGKMILHVKRSEGGVERMIFAEFLTSSTSSVPVFTRNPTYFAPGGTTSGDAIAEREQIKAQILAVCPPGSVYIEKNAAPEKMQLKLRLDYSIVEEQGQKAFERKIIQDLSNATSVDESRFRISRLSRGSVLVDAEVTHAPLGRGPPPQEVLLELERQAQSSDSLLRKGNLTRYIEAIAIFGANVPASPAPPPEPIVDRNDRIGITVSCFPEMPPIITEVQPGTFANSAGLLVGDRILTVSVSQRPVGTEMPEFITRIEVVGMQADEFADALKKSMQDARIPGKPGKLVLQVQRANMQNKVDTIYAEVRVVDRIANIPLPESPNESIFDDGERLALPEKMEPLMGQSSEVGSDQKNSNYDQQVAALEHESQVELATLLKSHPKN